jgi:hypothetical protein
LNFTSASLGQSLGDRHGRGHENRLHQPRRFTCQPLTAARRGLVWMRIVATRTPWGLFTDQIQGGTSDYRIAGWHHDATVRRSGCFSRTTRTRPKWAFTKMVLARPVRGLFHSWSSRTGGFLELASLIAPNASTA